MDGDYQNAAPPADYRSAVPPDKHMNDSDECMYNGHGEPERIARDRFRRKTG